MFYSSNTKITSLIVVLFIISCSDSNKKNPPVKNFEITQKNNDSAKYSGNDSLIQNKAIQEINDLSYLNNYDGKYPFDVNLFSTEPLKTRLSNLLGPVFSFFTRYNFVQPPIKVENDLFYIDGCQEHNCGYVDFILSIDLKSNIISIGIHENNQVSLYSENKSTLPQKLIKWENDIKESEKLLDETLNKKNKKEFIVGSIISNKEIEFSVEKTGYYETSRYIYKKDERNRIFYVSVYLKNLELSSFSYNFMNFTIKDSHGYVYEPTYWGAEPLFTYGYLSKDEIVRGFINFEIPPDIFEMKLIYSLSLFGDNKIVINLFE